MCKEEDTSIAVNNKLTLFKNGEKFKVFPKKKLLFFNQTTGDKVNFWIKIKWRIETVRLVVKEQNNLFILGATTHCATTHCATLAANVIGGGALRQSRCGKWKEERLAKLRLLNVWKRESSFARNVFSSLSWKCANVDTLRLCLDVWVRHLFWPCPSHYLKPSTVHQVFTLDRRFLQPTWSSSHSINSKRLVSFF